jgi:uncharacterized protein YchJ
MRLPALWAAIAIAWLATASVEAACLKANTPDQVAEGRLDSVRITIEAYRLKEQAYILRLASPACLEGDDEYDKIESTNRIHVFSLDDAMRKRLRSLVGKPVRVTVDAFGEHTAHHQRRSSCA